jgi:hypothetical protein
MFSFQFVFNLGTVVLRRECSEDSQRRKRVLLQFNSATGPLLRFDQVFWIGECTNSIMGQYSGENHGEKLNVGLKLRTRGLPSYLNLAYFLLSRL